MINIEADYNGTQLYNCLYIRSLLGADVASTPFFFRGVFVALGAG